jgi:hypothetical protein
MKSPCSGCCAIPEKRNGEGSGRAGTGFIRTTSLSPVKMKVLFREIPLFSMVFLPFQGALALACFPTGI